MLYPTLNLMQRGNKMDIEVFVKLLQEHDIDFFSGVPDSQLKPLCDYLINMYGISNNHIIAVNEGNAVALAAGYYLSTGKIPCVYLQNSGLGNIVNPVASLLNEKIYAIPCVFIIGWRGEPSVHDEPQHIFQGDDMSTLFWTYLNRTIYLMVYEFIVNNKIAFLALSRVK